VRDHHRLGEYQRPGSFLEEHFAVLADGVEDFIPRRTSDLWTGNGPEDRARGVIAQPASQRNARFERSHPTGSTLQGAAPEGWRSAEYLPVPLAAGIRRHHAQTDRSPRTQIDGVLHTVDLGNCPDGRKVNLELRSAAVVHDDDTGYGCGDKLPDQIRKRIRFAGGDNDGRFIQDFVLARRIQPALDSNSASE
jgi:hypothetical protein